MNRDQTCCHSLKISGWRTNQSTGHQVIGCSARLLPFFDVRTLLQFSYTFGLCCLAVAGLGLAAVPVNSQVQPQSSSAQPDTNARPILRLGSQGSAVTELQALLKLLGFYTGTVDGNYQESTATAVSAFQQAAGLQPDGVTGIETWNRLLPTAPALSPTAASAPSGQATPTQATPTQAAPSPTSASRPAPSPSPSFPAPTQATPSPSPAPSPAPSASSYTPFTPAPSPSPTPSSTSAPSPAGTASTSRTASGSTTEDERPVLRVGATGAAVTRLQEQLKAIGLFTGTVDGVFGAETEAAVQQAQRNYKLEPDGVVGPATWNALLQRR